MGKYKCADYVGKKVLPTFSYYKKGTVGILRVNDVIYYKEYTHIIVPIDANGEKRKDIGCMYVSDNPEHAEYSWEPLKIKKKIG
jgi:hypothetical protein